ncbi:hypothetical protein [Paraburkholderia fungorum]
MPFVIGSGKVQAIAKDSASRIGFWWAEADFDWWCEGINYEMSDAQKMAVSAKVACATRVAGD